MTPVHEPHPILESCVAVLRPGVGDEPVEIIPGTVQPFTDTLRSIRRSEELLDAVLTVVQFAHYLRQQRLSPTAADQLLHIVTEATLPALRQLGQRGAAVAAALQQKARAFQSFAGAQRESFEERRPPAAGQAKGSVLARYQFDDLGPREDK